MSSLLPLDDEPIAVIPAQAGIRKFKVMAALKSFRNAEAWIPACAGMTMDKGFFEFFKDRFGGGFRGQSPRYV